jgi:hypothetical protein
MVNVVKADGTLEPFSEDKLIASIKRAGIPESLNPQILDQVKKHLYEGIPTYEIYKYIEQYFGTSNEYTSKSKYSLKRALMELGPTGFPFEVFVAQILQAQGYKTEVGQTLLGKCVNHEVDVIATKGDEKLMVECKFHNRPGTRSDLHVALYTKARFDDLKDRHGFTKGVLATNTKITLDALAYSDCEKLGVLSWSYPEGDSLRDLIEKYKIYPVTQLAFLSLAHKQELLAKDIVLISQLCKNPNILDEISIPKDKRDEVVNHALEVCSL